MKKIICTPLLILMMLLQNSCQDPVATQTINSTFEYIPLDKYQYEHADIKPGTVLQILDYTGGEQNTKDKIYYCQFLAIDKSSGDTVRILAPLITIPSEGANDPKTYTTPTLYNPAKGITTAVYTTMDSTQNWALQSPENIMDTSLSVQNSRNIITATAMVVFNKDKPVFHQSTYKAAVGVLNFNGIPW